MTICCNCEERYIELDNIRLVVEDGKIVGWYNPGKEDKE